MKPQVIEVIVKPDGQTQVETKGFFGSGCRMASSFLEAALGVKTAEHLTAEFHQTQAAEQTLRQEGST